MLIKRTYRQVRSLGLFVLWDVCTLCKMLNTSVSLLVNLKYFRQYYSCFCSSCAQQWQNSQWKFWGVRNTQNQTIKDIVSIWVDPIVRSCCCVANVICFVYTEQDPACCVVQTSADCYATKRSTATVLCTMLFLYARQQGRLSLLNVNHLITICIQYLCMN